MNVLYSLRRVKQLFGSNAASGGYTWSEFYGRRAAFLRGLGIEKGQER